MPSAWVLSPFTRMWSASSAVFADVRPPVFIADQLHACRSSTQELRHHGAHPESASSLFCRFLVDSEQTLCRRLFGICSFLNLILDHACSCGHEQEEQHDRHDYATNALPSRTGLGMAIRQRTERRPKTTVLMPLATGRDSDHTKIFAGKVAFHKRARNSSVPMTAKRTQPKTV